MTALDALRPFLAEVAAPTPSVTGGSVSAVTAAAAAGLVAMTAHLGASPEQGHRAEELQNRALDLATSDSDSYAAVLAAQRRSRDDPERGPALREALAAAAHPPSEIAALAAEIAGLAADLATESKPSLRGDAITAATLAAGAAQGCAALARINVTSAGTATDVAEAAEAAAASARRHADAAGGA